MVVEAAVLAPVMIVVALIAINLMQFMGLSAQFDRLVPDAIIAHAVSPSGLALEQDSMSADVEAAVLQGLGGHPRVDVSVSVQTAWEAGSNDPDAIFGLSFAPHLRRYVCTLQFTPWPGKLSVAGIEAGIPLALEHTRSFTVDVYHPGILF